MTNTNERVTKKDNFMALRALVENLGDSQYDNLLAFIDKEVAALDNKAAKAKKYAMEKKEKSDELKNRIYDLLTTEFKSGDELVAELNDKEVTKNKVVARLTSLIKEGKVTKEKQKVDKTSVTKYKLVDTTDIETE